MTAILALLHSGDTLAIFALLLVLTICAAAIGLGVIAAVDLLRNAPAAPPEPYRWGYMEGVTAPLLTQEEMAVLNRISDWKPL